MAPRSLPLDVGSLAPQSVFQPSNGVLHFALELISFAFAFELAYAGYLSRSDAPGVSSEHSPVQAALPPPPDHGRQ